MTGGIPSATCWKFDRFKCKSSSTWHSTRTLCISLDDSGLIWKLSTRPSLCRHCHIEPTAKPLNSKSENIKIYSLWPMRTIKTQIRSFLFWNREQSRSCESLLIYAQSEQLISIRTENATTGRFLTVNQLASSPASGLFVLKRNSGPKKVERLIKLLLLLLMHFLVFYFRWLPPNERNKQTRKPVRHLGSRAAKDHLRSHWSDYFGWNWNAQSARSLNCTLEEVFWWSHMRHAHNRCFASSYHKASIRIPPKLMTADKRMREASLCNAWEGELGFICDQLNEESFCSGKALSSR